MKFRAATGLPLHLAAIDPYREKVHFLRRDCPPNWSEGFRDLAKVASHSDGDAVRVGRNWVDNAAGTGALPATAVTGLVESGSLGL